MEKSESYTNLGKVNIKYKRLRERRGALEKIETPGESFAIKDGKWVLWIETLSTEDLMEIKRAFAVYDKKGRGRISVNKIGSVIRKLGGNPSEEQLENIIEFYEEYGDPETIDFPDFATLMARLFHQFDDDLEEAFKVFDTNGDGKISSVELANTMKVNGAILTDNEIEEFMRKIDSDGNGFIEFDEFVKMASFNDL